MLSQQRIDPLTVSLHPAIARALANDEVRAAVVDHSDFATRHALAHVNRGFCASVRRPSRWAEFYGPALLDATTKTIYTGWRPHSAGSITHAYHSPLPAAPKPLGTFAEGAWTLRFDGPNTVPQNPALWALLDQVSELTYQGIIPNHGAAQSHAERVVGNRPNAYAFLRDRAYRLRHNMPIPTYSTEALFWMGSVVVSLVGLVALVACSSRVHAFPEERSNAHRFWAAAALTYYAGIVAYFGAESAGMRGLKNLYHAQRHCRQLDRACLKLQRIDPWGSLSVRTPTHSSTGGLTA